MECIRHNAVERARLEKALGLLAALVGRDTAFLPFFILFEEELQRLNATSAALDRARSIAQVQAGPGAVTRRSKKTLVPAVPRSQGPSQELPRITGTRR